MVKIIDTVNSVLFIRKFDTGVDLCEIEIGFDKILIYGEYNELLLYIGKTVEYSTRKDMLDGKLVTVVATIVETRVVQTLSATENIRLIPKTDITRAICNFDSTMLKTGDFEKGVIALLSDIELGQSPKSRWIDMKCIDVMSRQFIVRLFTTNIEYGTDAEAVISSFIGKYIKFDIESTKYGIQTSEVELVPADVLESPEVAIARSQIMSIIQNDPELHEYDVKYDFINRLSNIIYYEPGYHLVYIASEIYFIQTLCNITEVYDLQTMIRAAILSRGYLMPSNTKFSRPLLNVNKILGMSLGKDKNLLLILDAASEEESKEREMLIAIQKLVTKILDERRGIEHEKDFNDTRNNIMYECFGRLFGER